MGGGLTPCQARWSRMQHEPAGTGLTVESFIHRGSSSNPGMGSRDFCVPGIWRVTPLKPLWPTVEPGAISAAGALGQLHGIPRRNSPPRLGRDQPRCGGAVGGCLGLIVSVVTWSAPIGKLTVMEWQGMSRKSSRPVGSFR